MTDFQREFLGWAAAQPPLTGALIFGTGLVYAFFGFRVFRFLLTLTCAGLGCLLGAVAAGAAGLPPLWPSVGGILALAGLSAWQPKPAVAIVAAATWGMIGYYLAAQMHVSTNWGWMVTGVCGILGVLFAFLSYRAMTVILTTLQGVVLMVIGFMGLSIRVVPALGVTFRQWANGQALLVPIFLAMLFAAAYSYQTMHQQGDIETGR